MNSQQSSLHEISVMNQCANYFMLMLMQIDIMLTWLLCSKLCQHSLPRPTYNIQHSKHRAGEVAKQDRSSFQRVGAPGNFLDP